ncbi:N-acetyltransferase [Euhalothece natronophila Z-M001]|uniref:N-acetyltransferase n=1 Tax=Euhalothece natronophila Z-M001 TaxID=522448 RepID=A0A5B8NKS8_9CHRO|nr:GNAT family N-acetyltransferase [Euhalothece natronophila]QDZ39596.1 N-acetyltransferase [Euhalothece natronophila Z-M001]
MASMEPMGLNDLATVTAIFNEAIKAGETTQALEPKTIQQCQSWLLNNKPEYEAYVYREKAEIKGWMALTPFHEREAYSPTVELSVYVTLSARSQGIGNQLAKLGLTRARTLGFHSAMLLLFPQPVYRLNWAKRLGFVERGRLEGVVPIEQGWRDVMLFQLYCI